MSHMSSRTAAGSRSTCTSPTVPSSASRDSGDRRRQADGSQVLSCALITLPPNSLMAEIHNEKQRMPAVLREEDHDAWLQGSPQEAKASLVPHPSDTMVAWQVSRRLYAVKTPNDAALVEPVTR